MVVDLLFAKNQFDLLFDLDYLLATFDALVLPRTLRIASKSHHAIFRMCVDQVLTKRMFNQEGRLRF